MKASIALTVLILALGASIGWRDRQQVSAARELHEKLTREAEASGFSREGESTTAFKPRKRRKPEVRARFVMDGYLAYIRDVQRMGASSELQTAEVGMNERYMEIQEQIHCLDVDEAKLLIAELRSCKEVDANRCRYLILSIIEGIAKDRPSSALEILSESVASGADPSVASESRDVIDFAVKKWAEDDPAAALEWVRRNKGTFPVNQMDGAKEAIIEGAAIRDPQAAFRLLGEVDMEDPSDGMYSIMDACKTLEQMNAAVSGLQDYLNSIKDEKKKAEAREGAISLMAFPAMRSGFESGTKWLASANPSGDGMVLFAANLSGNISQIKADDADKWATWIAENSPANAADKSVRRYVEGWANTDYRAAAEWIKATPEGPVRNSATRAYAELVSQYEPETAVQWAATLPAGSDRDATLKKIRKNWAEKDAEAAAAFALKYGIK
jgi:hypothetical protein